MIDFIIGFIVGAFVALELGSRFMLHKLRNLGIAPPRHTTEFDESREWEWPL